MNNLKTFLLTLITLSILITIKVVSLHSATNNTAAEEEGICCEYKNFNSLLYYNSVLSAKQIVLNITVPISMITDILSVLEKSVTLLITSKGKSTPTAVAKYVDHYFSKSASKTFNLTGTAKPQ